MFDDGLRLAFYRVPEGDEPQPSLGMDPDDLEGLTEKRFPWMKQDIEIERELSGYVLIIDFGLGGDKSNIELDVKKITDFKIGIRDHGLFSLRHRFVVHPSTIEKGHIEEMLQQEIKVTLRPPKPDGQGSLPLEQQKKGRGRPKKTVVEKVQEEGDPFANSDLAQDETWIEGEQASRDGGEWPFPRPKVDETSDADQDEEAEQ
ncbi:hypothetical protein AX768_09010 [Burkholderia sp. PAMC 28687]|uniref:hypothetical protein n=1 Tax=Burkholderia sp. PAMC 28687 TaxID=1795874 RepID=UPI00078319C7|nr:hypothetical protein [Burkholderia sp. PAMC 28687]AMM14211.1 hypothetical protein AX768_09010 [Burkholderia sp. PAMC 28687]